MRNFFLSVLIPPILIVFILFFSSIFLGNSLSSFQLSGVMLPEDGYEKFESGFEMAHRTLYDSRYDAGSSAWQTDPYFWETKRLLLNADWPSWSPYVSSGFPSATGLLGFIIAPTRIIGATLALVLGNDVVGLQFSILLQVFLGAVSFFVLLIRFGNLHPWAAGCATIALVGSGMGQVTPPIMFMPYFALPLGALSVLLFVERPQSIPRFAFAVFGLFSVMTLPFLPIMILSLTFIAWIAFLLATTKYCLPAEPPRQLNKLPKAFLIVIVPFAIAIALVGYLLLPALYEIQHNGVIEMLETRNFDSLRAHDYLSLVSSKHFWEVFAIRGAGSGFEQYYSSLVSRNFSPSLAVNEFEEFKIQRDVFYIGIGSLFLISYGPFSKNLSLLHLGIIGVFILCVWRITGIFFAESIFPSIPVIGNIRITYWASIMTVSAAMLVGFGFHQLWKEKPRRLRIMTPILVLAGMIFLSYLYVSPAGGPDKLGLQYLAILAGISLLYILLTNPQMFWPKLSEERRRRILVLIPLLMLFEALYYKNLDGMRLQDPFESPPVAVLTAKIEIEYPYSGRVLNTSRMILQPDWGIAAEIPQAGNLNYLSILPWYRHFYETYIGTDHQILFLAQGRSPGIQQPLIPEALNVSGITHVITDNYESPANNKVESLRLEKLVRDGVSRLYRNENALPRFWPAHSVIDSDLLAYELGADSRSTVTSSHKTFLRMASEAGLLEAFAGQYLGAPAASVDVQSYADEEIVLVTKSNGPFILASSEVWHPGWSATIADQEQLIGRINIAFRGLVIPGGEHEVRFTYHHPYAGAGKLISILGMLGLVGGAGLLAVRSHRIKSLGQNSWQAQ